MHYCKSAAIHFDGSEKPSEMLFSTAVILWLTKLPYFYDVACARPPGAAAAVELCGEAHATLGRREEDERTWDHASGELAMAYLCLGVERRCVFMQGMSRTRGICGGVARPRELARIDRARRYLHGIRDRLWNCGTSHKTCSNSSFSKLLQSKFLLNANGLRSTYEESRSRGTLQTDKPSFLRVCFIYIQTKLRGICRLAHM